MGSYYGSIPTPYMIYLRELIKATTLVETGTYHGTTVRAAAPEFETVHTIELSPELYARTKDECKDLTNVHFHRGHTVEKLKEIMPQLTGPAIFWLDAHYFPDTFVAGIEEECPLLDEIRVINEMGRELGQTNVIMVDDARYFASPPPDENQADHWPDMQEVLNALNPDGSRYSFCLEDVIMSVPIAYKRQIQFTFSRIKPPPKESAAA